VSFITTLCEAEHLDAEESLCYIYKFWWT